MKTDEFYPPHERVSVCWLPEILAMAENIVSPQDFGALSLLALYGYSEPDLGGNFEPHCPPVNFD